MYNKSHSTCARVAHPPGVLAHDCGRVILSIDKLPTVTAARHRSSPFNHPPITPRALSLPLLNRLAPSFAHCPHLYQFRHLSCTLSRTLTLLSSHLFRYCTRHSSSPSHSSINSPSLSSLSSLSPLFSSPLFPHLSFPLFSHPSISPPLPSLSQTIYHSTSYFF